MLQKLILRKRRHQRIRTKLNGTADIPRLVVYRSLRGIQAQLIDDTEGKTLAASSDLKITKGTSMERAKNVGADIAKKAVEKKITACVFDRNGYKYHGQVKALADGAREGGLKF